MALRTQPILERPKANTTKTRRHTKEIFLRVSVTLWSCFGSSTKTNMLLSTLGYSGESFGELRADPTHRVRNSLSPRPSARHRGEMIPPSPLLYLNMLSCCVHFRSAEVEQKKTKGTKRRSSPR